MTNNSLTFTRRHFARTAALLASSAGAWLAFADPADAAQIDIAPTADGLPGGELFQKIVNWAGQIGIWFVVIAFVVGAGAWAVGGLSGNPQTAARGQKAIGVALLAAILLGGAAAILNLVYEAGGTIT